MKRIVYLFSIVAGVSLSLNASEQAPKGSGIEGIPHKTKISTLVAPNILPSGDTVLLTISTKKNENPDDMVSMLHQVVNKEGDISIFSRPSIGKKYAGKMDMEGMQLMMQQQRHLMFHFLGFLQEKNPELVDDFLSRSPEYSTTFTTEAKKPEAKEKKAGEPEIG